MYNRHFCLQNRQKTIKISNNVKSNPNTRSAHHLQHVHDLRMVWKPKVAGDENRIAQHIDSAYRPYKLVRRPAGILVPYPSQQNRLRDKRRTILSGAAESDPGGDFLPCIRCNRIGVLQRRITPVEPSCSRNFPYSGGLFRVYEINRQRFSAKS